VRQVVVGAPLPDDLAALVVASHGHDEEPLLTAALRAEVPYVGLVASRRRGAAVLASLDVPADRVYTPAGLDIGARTPAEVALSIYAQMVAERRAPALPEPHHESCH
jgi:xanthine dehydrogenase accessory factor